MILVHKTWCGSTLKAYFIHLCGAYVIRTFCTVILDNGEVIVNYHIFKRILSSKDCWKNTSTGTTELSSLAIDNNFFSSSLTAGNPVLLKWLCTTLPSLDDILMVSLSEALSFTSVYGYSETAPAEVKGSWMPIKEEKKSNFISGSKDLKMLEKAKSLPQAGC